MPAGMVARTLVVPLAFDPRMIHPPIGTVAAPRLNSSMNSSLPPLGPRNRNSLMTMSLLTARGDMLASARHRAHADSERQARRIIDPTSETDQLKPAAG